MTTSAFALATIDTALPTANKIDAFVVNKE